MPALPQGGGDSGQLVNYDVVVRFSTRMGAILRPEMTASVTCLEQRTASWRFPQERSSGTGQNWVNQARDAGRDA